MSVSTSGFALRANGSCQSNEVDCGTTVAPYHGCCPAKSFCPNQYNIDCCPSSANCTSELVKYPQCANETWDLYDNGGYFCCLKGYTGYASTTDSDGCAEPGYAFKKGEVLLNIISAGQVSTSSASSTRTSSPTSSSPGKTSSSRPVATKSSKSNTGAIVGGVVGGAVALILVALAIWFLRRRKASKREETGSIPEQVGVQEKYGNEISPKRSPLGGEHALSEMDAAEPPTQLADQHGVSELAA